MAEFRQVDNDVIVDREGMTRILGIGLTKFRQLEREGMPFVQKGLNKSTKWLFKADEVVNWYYGRTISDLEGQVEDLIKDKDFDDKYSKSRKLHAEASLKELELATEQGKLANIDDIMSAFAEALSKVRANLIALPSRTSGLLEHQEQRDIEKILDEEIRNTLEELSEYQHGNNDEEEPPLSSDDLPPPPPPPIL